MKRIYPAIPNVAFHKIIRQYAFETGRPVLTLKSQQEALLEYINIASRSN